MEELIKRREQLIEELAKKEGMIFKVYKIYRRCGKKGCRCEREKGYKHGPVWCIHYKEKGKLKSLYIPGKYIEEIKKQVKQYEDYKKIGQEICRINIEILKKKIKKG